jgi:hypothetical protein
MMLSRFCSLLFPNRQLEYIPIAGLEIKIYLRSAWRFLIPDSSKKFTRNGGRPTRRQRGESHTAWGEALSTLMEGSAVHDAAVARSADSDATEALIITNLEGIIAKAEARAALKPLPPRCKKRKMDEEGIAALQELRKVKNAQRERHKRLAQKSGNACVSPPFMLPTDELQSETKPWNKTPGVRAQAAAVVAGEAAAAATAAAAAPAREVEMFAAGEIAGAATAAMAGTPRTRYPRGSLDSTSYLP